MKKSLGIYFHIPFCKAKCGYCDFYSIAGADNELIDNYISAMEKHLEEYAPSIAMYQVDTVYFGGGTPSLIGAKRIKRLISAVKKNAKISRGAEITVEANPESTDIKFLKGIKSAGVNRVSFGVQSADDEMLKAIGRLHNFEDAKKAVCDCRNAGIDNISLDLMYGLPGQSRQNAIDSLNRLIELNPDHISAYALKLEQGVPMYSMLYELPDDDEVSDTYLEIVSTLENAGYAQYEISNFAKNGKISRHNSKYWDLSEYLGIGAAAYSFFGGKRFSCIPDVSGYIEAVNCGQAVICDDYEIFQNEKCGEYIMLGLRTVKGINRDEYRKKFRKSFDKIEQAMKKYIEGGFAVELNGNYRLTPKGFLVSNHIISEVTENV